MSSSEKSLLIQVSVKVLGCVQGVGFRMFVFEKARKLGILGWIKNCSDGSVEAIYQGPKNLVEEMIEKTKQGPFLSRVQNVEVLSSGKNLSPFSNFSILP